PATATVTVAVARGGDRAKLARAQVQRKICRRVVAAPVRRFPKLPSASKASQWSAGAGGDGIVAILGLSGLPGPFVTCTSGAVPGDSWGSAIACAPSSGQTNAMSERATRTAQSTIGEGPSTGKYLAPLFPRCRCD